MIFFKEIQNNAELLEFSLRLQKANDQMKDEKAKQAAMKRKSAYTDNLDRSK